MDFTACVARRTRSKTEQYLNLLLRRSKGIADDRIEDPSKKDNEGKMKRKASLCGFSYPSSAPAKRRRRRGPRPKAAEQEVEFIGDRRIGNHEVIEVDDESVSSDSSGLLGLNLKHSEVNRPSSDDAVDNPGKDVVGCPNEVVEIVDDKSFEEKSENASIEEVFSHGFDDDVEYASNENQCEINSVETTGNFDDNDEDRDDEEGGLESESSCSLDEILSSSDEESSGDSENSCPKKETRKADALKKGNLRNTEAESRKKKKASCLREKALDLSSSAEEISGNSENFRPEKGRQKADALKKDNLRSTEAESLKKMKASCLRGKALDLSSSVEENSAIRENFCPEKEKQKADALKKGNLRNTEAESRKKKKKASCLRGKDLDVFQVLFKPVVEKGGAFRTAGVSSYHEQENYRFAQVDPPSLNPNFGYEEPKPTEKSESEKELDRLWDEMEFALRSDEIDSADTIKTNDKETATPGTKVNQSILCSKLKHVLVLDEEIGLKCYYCSFVATEIEHICPTMDMSRQNNKNYRRYFCEYDDSLFSRLGIKVSNTRNPLDSTNLTGSVWECIPGVKDTLYQHQQEGFEFIWRNIGGSIYLDDLKNSNTAENGGCIISHSPGTGKTRLTLVFVQAYLELFPDSHPVIIAPASLLLTWEEEFRKWNVNIPFYNMNSLELSGKESMSAVSILEGNRHHGNNTESIRMVKIYSWINKKSVLGISYHMFEKLAGEKSEFDYKTKKGNKMKIDKKWNERQELRKILLETPGLLVLDEGHTPRNQRSCIWKVLTRVETQKRIILSGTPFQNNFQELSNILCLTRPAYADKISYRLKNLIKLNSRSKRGQTEEEAGIKKLRALIAPFVHVHKGSILQKKLPGLRDCVVVLNPQPLQKRVLDSIDRRQNTFELEHKLSAVSVHPSLLLSCAISATEKSLIGQSLLERLGRLKLQSDEGVKTRFLIKFIRFSESINEKVLVFSQYIDTLSIVMEQLNSLFGWSEGREILMMHGKLEQKQRQFLINSFNDPNSKARVFLASTRACSEGINLVGASRVVLLDVVWNPSVERQAISRAYRIGQKRVVYTYHLVIKGTQECDKYCKQAEKYRMSEMVFSTTNDTDKQTTSRGVAEDKVLDEMVWHEKMKDMFDKIIYQPKEIDLVESFASVAP